MMNKNEIIEYYFGDIIRELLLERKIPIALIPPILIWLIVYFRVMRPHKKGIKYTVKEIIYLGIAIYMTLMSIALQTLVSIGYGER